MNDRTDTSGGLRIGIGVAVIVLMVVAVYSLPINEWISGLVEWATNAGPTGAIAFGLVYVLATVLLAPATPLSLAAGLVYGPLIGAAVVIPSATLGATLAFVLGRTLLRGRVEARVADYPRFLAFDHAIGRRGLFIMFLVRLSPAFPFNLLNYFAGLTSLSLRDYVVATFFGIMPGCVVVVYLGSSLTRISQLFDGSASAQGPSWPFWLGLVATLIAAVTVAKIAKSSLDSEISGP